MAKLTLVVAIRECMHIYKYFGIQHELVITIKDITACIVSLLYISELYVVHIAVLISSCMYA